MYFQAIGIHFPGKFRNIPLPQTGISAFEEVVSGLAAWRLFLTVYF
jgi:hypothetical protein